MAVGDMYEPGLSDAVSHHAKMASNALEAAEVERHPFSRAEWLQYAQVHATLALARATEASAPGAQYGSRRVET